MHKTTFKTVKLMTYQWKIVLRDALGNEYLMAFCKDMQEAKTKMAVAEKEKSANNAIGELSMKAVNPEWIPEPTASDYTMFVQSLMSAAEWEIIRNNPNLSKFFANDHGRMREFYLLSKIVPKYYTVINFGCGNNAQSYLFTKHKRYIAVDTDKELFRAPGTLFYQTDVHKFISETMPQLKLKMSRTFAICSHVTGEGENNPGMLTRMNFLNLYTFNNFKKINDHAQETQK